MSSSAAQQWRTTNADFCIYLFVCNDQFCQGTGTVQVTSMPNGTGPSPPPQGGTVKGYPLNFVIKGNSTTQGVTGVTPSPGNLTKGQNIIFNNMGMHQSQFIVQPSSSLSPTMHQRGTI